MNNINNFKTLTPESFPVWDSDSGGESETPQPVVYHEEEREEEIDTTAAFIRRLECLKEEIDVRTVCQGIRVSAVSGTGKTYFIRKHPIPNVLDFDEVYKKAYGFPKDQDWHNHPDAHILMDHFERFSKKFAHENPVVIIGNFATADVYVTVEWDTVKQHLVQRFADLPWRYGIGHVDEIEERWKTHLHRRSLGAYGFDGLYEGAMFGIETIEKRKDFNERKWSVMRNPYLVNDTVPGDLDASFIRLQVKHLIIGNVRGERMEMTKGARASSLFQHVKLDGYSPKFARIAMFNALTHNDNYTSVRVAMGSEFRIMRNRKGHSQLRVLQDNTPFLRNCPVCGHEAPRETYKHYKVNGQYSYRDRRGNKCACGKGLLIPTGRWVFNHLIPNPHINTDECFIDKFVMCIIENERKGEGYLQSVVKYYEDKDIPLHRLMIDRSEMYIIRMCLPNMTESDIQDINDVIKTSLPEEDRDLFMHEIQASTFPTAWSDVNINGDTIIDQTDQWQ
jgi:hypothetical protein